MLIIWGCLSFGCVHAFMHAPCTHAPICSSGARCAATPSAYTTASLAAGSHCARCSSQGRGVRADSRGLLGQRQVFARCSPCGMPPSVEGLAQFLTLASRRRTGLCLAFGLAWRLCQAFVHAPSSQHCCKWHCCHPLLSTCAACVLLVYCCILLCTAVLHQGAARPRCVCAQVQGLTQFLTPLLAWDPEPRPAACTALDHPSLRQ
jgi:hypothetical protein